MYFQLRPEIREQLKKSSDIPFEKNKIEACLPK
jgi:hypothetical protein